MPASARPSFPNNFQQFGLKEPQRLSSSHLAAPSSAISSINSALGARPGAPQPFDPTCPVSVAMAKLKGMVELATPAGDAATAAPTAASQEEAATLSARLSAVTALLPGSLHSRLLQADSATRAQTEGGAGAAGEGADGSGARDADVDNEEAEEEEEEEDVPIECLRFFKLLNRKSQT